MLKTIRNPFALLVSGVVGLSWTLSAVAQTPTTPTTPLTTTQPAATDSFTHDYDIAGITVKVTELKRTANDIVTLRWTYVNSSDKAIELTDTGNPYKLAEDIYLLDLKGKKQYHPLTAGAYPLARKHGNTVVVEAGKQYDMWVRFPAPPADVKTIDVYMEGVSEPFEAVPITN